MKWSKPISESSARIQKSIEFIRDNISRSITVADAAKIACYSEYHFQRLFKDEVGESFGAYVTRKKLETAAIKIAYGRDVNLTDIAFRYGYSSLSNFSKAFERFFGVRPSEIRDLIVKPPKKPGKLQDRYSKELVSKEMFTDEPHPTEEGLKVRFRNVEDNLKITMVEPFDVIFLSSRKGYEIEGVQGLWQEIEDYLQDLNLPSEQVDRFAICHDHPALFPKEKCRYDACLRYQPGLEALPFLRTTIPGGRFAVFSCKGPPEAVLDQYIEFSKVWLPRSGYEPTDFPVVDHLLPPDRAPYIQELWRHISRV